MTSGRPGRAHPKGSQPRPGGGRRTYQIMVRVNAAELAELERRRSRSGLREMGAYVRAVALAGRGPRAVAPELNRAAWLALAEHLARLQELAGQLAAVTDRQRGGLAGLVGWGRLEETVASCLEELRAQSVAIQVLRRSLLSSDRVHR